MVPDQNYFALRRCLREPIPEISLAAEFLSLAADAHLLGDHAEAKRLLRQADIDCLHEWTDSLWGSSKSHPEQRHYLRTRPVEGAPPYLGKDARSSARMPTVAEKSEIIRRDGFHCVFCHIPVIRPEVRQYFRKRYPEEVAWGKTVETQHAAFQCMWLQFDHLLPHCRGGDNALENIVITCAPCNFGRMSSTLEEVGLVDPRLIQRAVSSWDGLERVMA